MAGVDGIGAAALEPDEKGLILEEARAPGASVSEVARRHGVNANLLFKWLRIAARRLPQEVPKVAAAEAPAPSATKFVALGVSTPDEATGGTAREARAVFNSEPGRPSGNVVTGRTGGVFLQMDVLGKAAHSGGAFQDGISAIAQLAHKIVALQGITDLGRGVTLNVGLISGGQSVNTVAPRAEAQIDLRYVEPADRDIAVAEIERIAATATVPGTSARVEVRGEFSRTGLRRRCSTPMSAPRGMPG